MKQVTLRFSANDLFFTQTIVLEDENISVEDFIEGLKDQSFLTTTWHERGLYEDTFLDVPVINKEGKQVGYVKSQEVEEVDRYRNFQLIDSIDL